MGCKDKYHGGMLIHKVTMQKPTDVTDTGGGVTRTWSGDGLDIPAKVSPLSGGEQFKYGRNIPNAKLSCVMRFKGDDNGNPYYSISHKLTFRALEYNVAYVEDVDLQGRWLKLILSDSK